MRRLVTASILHTCVALLGIGVIAARADDVPPSHVSGQGGFELKKQPEFLRIQVEVLAKARSAKDALVKLQERRQAARTKLEGMGAAADSIEFSDPSIVAEFDQRERQMQAMMAQQQMMMQMQQGGKKPAAKAKEAPPVVVSCTLKAQIHLNAPNAEEMLILTSGLEERIKAADLGGAKALKQGTPQEEEQALEQMQNMGGWQGNMNGDEQRVRGQPIIYYVSKVSAEDRKRVVREAFKRAERQAGEVASAAGLVLGPVHSLEETNFVNPDSELTTMISEYGVNPVTGRMTVNAASDEKGTAEASGAKPANVVYRVTIAASFELRRVKPR
jgi:uncharacterized protein YggE